MLGMKFAYYIPPNIFVYLKKDIKLYSWVENFAKTIEVFIECFNIYLPTVIVTDYWLINFNK